MDNQNINYTIGDKIVCIQDHSLGLVKKGQTFTCLALKKGECQHGCNYIVVDVGIYSKETSKIKSVYCKLCNKSTMVKNDNLFWFWSGLFIKEDYLLTDEQLKEALGDVLELDIIWN